MIKLVIFDLDNTLAPVGKGTPMEAVEYLKEIEKRGIRIAICSGKPTFYSCGFARQMELEKPILIGENGAVIQFGVDLPPETYEIQPYSKEAKKTIVFDEPRTMQQSSALGIKDYTVNVESGRKEICCNGRN